MNYELTKHAQKALEERGIQIEWLERTLSAPECEIPLKEQLVSVGFLV